MTKTKVETVFQKELQLIHNKDIKDFVITCFDKLCPDYFWTCPCSTSGKYHPQVALGVGGLVRHTKLAVWWGLELINALRKSPGIKDISSDKLIDETVATLLLHDMVKNGRGLNAQGYSLEKGVTGTHGVTLAGKILESVGALNVTNNSYDRILNGIAGHMGIWTTESMCRPDSITDSTQRAFAQLIHLADYAASRKVDEIYRKLEQEKTDDIIQKTAKQISKSPPCPSIRKTESC